MEVKQRYQIIHQVRMKGLHWRNQANLQRPSKCTSHFGFSLALGYAVSPQRLDQVVNPVAVTPSAQPNRITANRACLMRHLIFGQSRIVRY